MKRLISIFRDQLRSKEIWTRLWELGRFHSFKNYQEWKKYSFRPLSIEDVPAIMIATLFGIFSIIILNIFFGGEKLKYALLCYMVFIIAISKLFEAIKKRKGNIR